MNTSLFQRIKTTVSVRDVAERHTELRKSGGHWVCRCLCGGNTDRNPSFHIWDDHAHCFACGTHVASAVHLRHLIATGQTTRPDDAAFGDACALVAAEHGVGRAGRDDSPRHSPSVEREPARRLVTAETKHALAVAADWYARQLVCNSELLRTLTATGKVGVSWDRQPVQGRGLCATTIERLKLGYAPGRGLARALHRAGVDLQVALRARLLTDRGEALRERIVIPVHNAQGEIVYLMGRAIYAGATAKYVGLAAGATYKQPACWGDLSAGALFVEGCFDLAAALQWQVDARMGVVALLGTAHEQALRYLPALNTPARDGDLIALDQDHAGLSAALKLVERLRMLGRDARVVLDLDRRAMRQAQTAFASDMARNSCRAELDAGAAILAGGWALPVRWGGSGDSPGKLAQLGGKGRAMFEQICDEGRKRASVPVSHR